MKIGILYRKGKDMQTGSNGFGSSQTASGNAILYINPILLFFRPEIQMSSEEGLNAYGAVTWGQFFIYQGFNENCGWMHSTNVDVADMYAEKIVTKNDKLFYEYNSNYYLSLKKLPLNTYKKEN
jgi:acyl-homoserine lactone acylase PvdQ